FDLRFGDLLQSCRPSLGVVLGNIAILLQLVDSMHLVAPHIANRDASLLRLLPHELHILAATLFGERWDRDADDLPVARRIQSLVTRPQGLLDGADLAL